MFTGEVIIVGRPDISDKSKDKKISILLLLQVLLAVYSFSGVFSKLASATEFLSFRFCLYYGCIIILLGIYAIGWQQIIKRLPLTTAFANKAVTVVWGIIWGAFFFDEKISVGKIAGAILVIAGVVLFSKAGEENDG